MVTTEDCYFTRNVSLLYADSQNAGCFCAWNCWAWHHKICKIGRPEKIRIDQVGRSYRQAVLDNQTTKQSVQVVQRDPRLPPPTRRTVAQENGNGSLEGFKRGVRELTAQQFPANEGDGDEI
jgi:hypothetical protein